jgi:transcription elongation factor GreA-like protein
MNMEILEVLKGKWEDGTRPKDLYTEYISKNPETYIEILMQGLDSDEKRVQSGSSELVSLLSEDHPELLIGYVDKFIDNLDAKEPVLRWEAVCTLGNLARLDEKKKIIPVLPRLYPLLQHKSIVLANHTVQALSKIAESNPEKAEEILNELIKNAPLFKKTTVGFIIEAMARFKDYELLVPKVRKFIEPYLDSKMKVVVKKAKKTLKKLG